MFYWTNTVTSFKLRLVVLFLTDFLKCFHLWPWDLPSHCLLSLSLIFLLKVPPEDPPDQRQILDGLTYEGAPGISLHRDLRWGETASGWWTLSFFPAVQWFSMTISCFQLLRMQQSWEDNSEQKRYSSWVGAYTFLQRKRAIPSFPIKFVFKNWVALWRKWNSGIYCFSHI